MLDIDVKAFSIHIRHRCRTYSLINELEEEVGQYPHGVRGRVAWSRTDTQLRHRRRLHIPRTTYLRRAKMALDHIGAELSERNEIPTR